MNWYILWVNSRQYQTQKYQSQTYKILKGVEAWIPSARVLSKSGDDCSAINEPVFPGYIFVGIHDPQQLIDVETEIHKAGLGFYFLRGLGGKYHSMTYAELEKMVQSGYEGALDTYDSGIRVGRKVRISVGPYTGVVGKVTSITRRDIRVEATCLKKDLLVIVHRKNYLVLEPM